MKYDVFIDGGEGTTGLKIHGYLRSREDVRILGIDARKRKDPEERLSLMRKSDISFLCLPDQAAREIVSAAPGDIRIIDTSTAHRTAEDWVYGLPELPGQRHLIRDSLRTTNPGCHATGAIVLIRPLVESGLAPADYPFAITSLTGYSGGGKKMIRAYEEEGEELVSPRQYGLTQEHKHIPEIMKMTGLARRPSFMPVVGAYYSGMQVIVPVTAEKRKVEKLFREYYEGEEMIRVNGNMDEDGFISSDRLAGTDRLEIGIYGNDGNVLLVSCFDNLGKGASGAAVQNMNIMLGTDERKGLVL